MRPTFSIVVPVYNEAEFIPQAVPALIEQMESIGQPYRIIIVENGSTDATAKVARQVAAGHAVTVLSIDAADYGAAMRAGFLEAEGDWVVNFDIDYFSADFLKRVLALDDVDLVIASKRDPDSEDRRSLLRRVATWVFNLLLRTILDSKVSDTHGMKAFRDELVSTVAPSVLSRQDLFDTELVIRAERAAYRIEEVPVVVEEMRVARSSLVKRVPRTIKGLWRIRRTLADESLRLAAAHSPDPDAN
ncbi:MAG TPA: glycosyltransferase family 2 protein [Acidimicrobiia bacterium]|nr:glycosyltransferase family 2 protein [Acidimicrobiia bacterium]